MNRCLVSLVFRTCVALAVCAVATTYTCSVHAEDPTGSAIVLVVENVDGLDPEVLRSRVAAELGVAVVLGPSYGRGTLAVRGTGNQVAISFASGGKIVGRTLGRSEDSGVLIDTVVLISGNLVRDEAADLLKTLRRPAPASADAESAASTAPAPAAATPVKTAASTREPLVLSPCDPSRRRTNVGVDFVPMLGSSLVDSDEYRAFSLGVLGTTSAGLRGFELASLFTHMTGDVCGAQIAGVANIVGQRVHGAQLGGVLNVAQGSVYGTQMAGVVNVGGQTDGLQMAGVVNVASGSVHGAQLAGVVNVASGSVRGAQIGVVNVAGGDVHGTQIGVVNVARDSDASIGLFSFLSRGRTTLDVWGTDSGLVMAGAEHGGRVLHNVWGVGGRFAHDANRFVGVIGLGGRAVSTDRVTLDVDLLYHWFMRGHWKWNTSINQARVVVGVRVADGLRLIGGPTYSVMVTDDAKESTHSLLGTTTWTDEGASTRVVGWPGFMLGARVF